MNYTRELVPPPGGGVGILCTCQGLRTPSITTTGEAGCNCPGKEASSLPCHSTKASFLEKGTVVSLAGCLQQPLPTFWSGVSGGRM